MTDPLAKQATTSHLPIHPLQLLFHLDNFLIFSPKSSFDFLGKSQKQLHF